MDWLPVLVLVGEHDEAPPPISRELVAGRPDARLTILRGCAHVPQLQKGIRRVAPIGQSYVTRPPVERRCPTVRTHNQ